MWVCFWALYYITVIHMSVFVPLLCCSDHFSFIVLSEVLEGYATCFVLFPHDYFGDSGSFMVPYSKAYMFLTSAGSSLSTGCEMTFGGQSFAGEQEGGRSLESHGPALGHLRFFLSSGAVGWAV